MLQANSADLPHPSLSVPFSITYHDSKNIRSVNRYLYSLKKKVDYTHEPGPYILQLIEGTLGQNGAGVLWHRFLPIKIFWGNDSFDGVDIETIILEDYYQINIALCNLLDGSLDLWISQMF